MKRLFVIILALCLLLSGCGSGVSPAESFQEEEIPEESVYLYAPEFLRAAEYGFLPESMPKNPEEHISFSEFVFLMDRLLALYGVEGSDIWQQLRQNAQDTSIMMNRSEGALVLYYAAREAGLDKDIIFYNMEATDETGFDFWEGLSWEPHHIPGFSEAYIDPVSGEPIPHLNMLHAAGFFITRRISAVDGSMLLELDEGRSFRFGDPMTWDDAVKALVRLHESNWDVARKVDVTSLLTEEGLACFEAADARREAILNSPTEVTVTGKSYYVANHGSDSNNGLSPETPWATVEKVNKQHLKAGDAVFFNRGDIWRADCLVTREGVTYSAYGEGSKPIFTSSPEDGAAPEKWELFYEDETGKKIWKFYADVTDCGNIYFDGGKDWGFKRTGHWRWGKWVDDDDQDLDIIALLNKDLAFFGDSSSALPKTNTVEPITFYALYTTGPVYLRCDRGNPGEVFSSIEFGAHAKGFSRDIIAMHNGVTLDNLSVRYTANHGLCISPTDGTIQNCEIACTGGNIQIDNYREEWSHNLESVTCGGGGITFGGSNNAILNCYIHDTYQESFVIERKDWIHDGLTVKGNLFGNTLAMIFNHLGEVTDRPYLSNAVFEDNISLMTGYNWGDTQDSMQLRYGVGIGITSTTYTLDNVAFRNNTLVGCYGYQLQLSPTTDGQTIPIMENNTFCALSPDAIGYYKSNPARQLQYPIRLSERALAEDVGNDTNKFVILEQKQSALQ